VERFDIYLRGFLGSEPAVVGLQRVFGVDAKRASQLLRSLPRIVKRDVPSEQVARYQHALDALDADYELRRSPIRPQRVIAVSGGAAPLGDDLDLPNLAWSRPAPPAAVLAVADGWVEPAHGPLHAAAPTAPAALDRASSTALEARGARALGATWSESRPPPRSLGDTLVEARAAPPSRASARPQPLSATVPESLPPPASATHAADALTWAHPPELVQPHAARLSIHAAEPQPAPPSVEQSQSRAWAPIAPAELAPPTVGPPAAWQAGALDVALERRGQPGWLLENRDSHEHSGYAAEATDGEGDPFDPPPSLSPVTRAQAAPSPTRPETPALQSVRPARGPTLAEPAVRRVAPAVGTATAGEPVDEPSPWLRWAVRVGIGLSLFVILNTARRAFETGVDDALARWSAPATVATASAAGAQANGAHGPDALTWLEPDLHLVSSGDKDRVRALAGRFVAAGAPGVFVGTISSMGMTKVAGELIVQLPAEPTARKAVLDVYDQFLAASFGGVAVGGAEPEGDVLRITF
jgi:hypothetical protein